MKIKNAGPLVHNKIKKNGNKEEVLNFGDKDESKVEKVGTWSIVADTHINVETGTSILQSSCSFQLATGQIITNRN